ncbi:hypothetical protein, partial [Paraburkholderia sediminicola]|uniref:hypothetical protein n=1 Tax=Paraburkholderia sediminicola TaxID=458836 RepID=UPI0038BAFD4A
LQHAFAYGLDPQETETFLESGHSSKPKQKCNEADNIQSTHVACMVHEYWSIRFADDSSTGNCGKSSTASLALLIEPPLATAEL